MAYREDVAERVRQMLRSHAGISERKMFDGLGLLARGHMFVAVMDNRLMARIGPDAYADALTMPHVSVMDFTGTPMTGYVFVDPAGFASEDALAYWVNKSHAFVASLPPNAD